MGIRESGGTDQSRGVIICGGGGGAAGRAMADYKTGAEKQTRAGATAQNRGVHKYTSSRPFYGEQAAALSLA